MKAPVTQKEIARAAGVSQNTVSLALRADSRIPEATRDRIRILADRMGYRPNPLVAALMAQVKRRRPAYQSTLAMIMEGPSRKKLDEHPSLKRALQGARERAGERGYRLEEFWLRDRNLPISRLESMLHARGIHGIIWHPRLGAENPPALNWDRYAAVVLAVLDRRFAAFHSASTQPFRHVETALTELARRGSRRPALAIPPRYEWIMDQLYTGAVQTFPQKLGLSPIPPFTGDTWTRKAFLAWWRKHRPDALLVRSTEVLDWLGAIRVRVPEDVRLVHLGWHRGLRGWAGIDPAPESIGAGAVDLLVDQLNANERGMPALPKMVLTGGRWIEGDTAGRPAD